MTFVQELLAAFANCDLHFCIYAAYGITLMLGAAFCSAEHNPGEAREHFVRGVVYLSLGLLK
jgi:hypothetical protein